MSNVNVLLIIEDKVYNFNVHYRTFIKLLEKNFEPVKSLPSKYLDSGFVVVDMNKKMILESQTAIDINQLVGKKFEVIGV